MNKIYVHDIYIYIYIIIYIYEFFLFSSFSGTWPMIGSFRLPTVLNKFPHRVASKGDDENYDESPSGGVWGHGVLDTPQWSRPPKIFRGKKRAKNNRKKKIKGGRFAMLVFHHVNLFASSFKTNFMTIHA